VFADGTDDVGDLVVGADGAFSRVRRQLHPDIGLVRSELVAAMGRTPASNRFAPFSSGGGAMIQGPGLNLTVGPMLFRTPPAVAAPELPATEDYLRWQLMLPRTTPWHRRPTGDPTRRSPAPTRATRCSS
jgi:2-polyprenyl-6-methoxyphenol hydroxylase-like FAD-dependent oxidoreductase